MTKSRKRRREPTPPRRSAQPAGWRAERPEQHEGLTPELIAQMRAMDDGPDPRVPRQRTPYRSPGMGIRETLASIDSELREDAEYQHALSRLAYGG